MQRNIHCTQKQVKLLGSLAQNLNMNRLDIHRYILGTMRSSASEMNSIHTGITELKGPVLSRDKELIADQEKILLSSKRYHTSLTLGLVSVHSSEAKVLDAFHDSLGHICFSYIQSARPCKLPLLS